MTQQVGDYRLDRLLGEGGMGAVYLAHRVQGRGPDPVAIKVLHGQYVRNESFRARFKQEAELGRRLDHPGLVNVYELIENDTHVALVMELVSGRPLSTMIGVETGPIPWTTAWPLFSRILDAVEHAHAHGVVHRDLKPDNVMVGEYGQVKVLDFGIAKQGDSKMTRTGSGFGTVDYMAPEQYLDAKNVDQRADIYALGMTLFHMLAGRLPWDSSETEFKVMLRKSQGELPSPRDYYPHIPATAVHAIGLAVAVDKDRRPDSLAALRSLLEYPLPQAPETAPPTQAPEPPAPEPDVGPGVAHEPAPATDAVLPDDSSPVPAEPPGAPAADHKQRVVLLLLTLVGLAVAVFYMLERLS